MPFHVGQKVLPISKSILSSLDESTEWTKAKQKGQPFLVFKYFTDFERKKVAICETDFDLDTDRGDAFLISDLKPFLGELNQDMVYLLNKE